MVEGWEGDDRLFGNDGHDEISAGPGNDRLFGHRGDDWLNGGSGKDRLVGGEGNDDVDGGEGNDVVRGGPGADTRFGSPGNDEFVIDQDPYGMELDRNRIADFVTGEDKLVILGSAWVPDGISAGFDALDTNSDGLLDGSDDGVSLLGSSMSLDISQAFGRPAGSD